MGWAAEHLGMNGASGSCRRPIVCLVIRKDGGGDMLGKILYISRLLTLRVAFPISLYYIRNLRAVTAQIIYTQPSSALTISKNQTHSTAMALSMSTVPLSPRPDSQPNQPEKPKDITVSVYDLMTRKDK
jgi:hypothetical protein